MTAFEETEQRYWELRRKLASGLISAAEFYRQAGMFRILGPDQAWWQIRPEDGIWFRWDGQAWQAANPPQPGEAVSPPIAAGSIPDQATIAENAPGWSLVIVAGAQPGERFHLGDQVRLGRGLQTDIYLPDLLASRQHAIIRRDGPTYFIEDSDSTNGTYLNDKRVAGLVPLRAGDVIRIGETKLRIEID